MLKEFNNNLKDLQIETKIKNEFLKIQEANT